MTKGFVRKILPFSSVDGPGNRTAIFLQGCNFNCLYCHNPETINKFQDCLHTFEEDTPSKPLAMTVEEVLKKINKTKAFISGITVSGGECTLQAEFLVELFKEVKKMDLTCFIDTNGSVPLYKNKALVELMDMAMVDLKSYDPEEHKMLTEAHNPVVIDNIKYLAKINKLYEIRTVVVPELLNNPYNINMTSKLIASLNPKIKYKLIKYRPQGVRPLLINSYVPSDAMMEELKTIAENNGCKNVILV